MEWNSRLRAHDNWTLLAVYEQVGIGKYILLRKTARVACCLLLIAFSRQPPMCSQLLMPSLLPHQTDAIARPEHFLVHNLTGLRPQSAFWYRVRARNPSGISDWTAIASTQTEDTQDSTEVQAPEQMHYQLEEQRLRVEPLKNSLSHCLLLYVVSREDGTWRTVK